MSKMIILFILKVFSPSEILVSKSFYLNYNVVLIENNLYKLEDYLKEKGYEIGSEIEKPEDKDMMDILKKYSSPG